MKKLRWRAGVAGVRARGASKEGEVYPDSPAPNFISTTCEKVDEVDGVITSLNNLGDDAGAANCLEVLSSLLRTHVYELHRQKKKKKKLRWN